MQIIHIVTAIIIVVAIIIIPLSCCNFRIEGSACQVGVSQ